MNKLICALFVTLLLSGCTETITESETRVSIELCDINVPLVHDVNPYKPIYGYKISFSRYAKYDKVIILSKHSFLELKKQINDVKVDDK